MNDYTLDARLDFIVRQGFGRVGGRFETVEGSLYVEGDELSSASVQVTIRTGSIQTRNKRRDQHLRRSFLGSAEYPLATFLFVGYDVRVRLEVTATRAKQPDTWSGRRSCPVGAGFEAEVQ